MQISPNAFKHRLAAGDVLYGMWMGLADPIAAEISALAGFDWLVIDGEHAPNDLREILVQLQVLNGYPVSPIVRVPRGETSLIKQYLDLGAQTILVPMVESVAQAEEMVRAVRYPPAGVRGLASARAARWGRIADYASDANDEMCVLLQIETVAGVANLEAIAAVDGVDGLFIGPSDLGASLGYLGQPNHPDVRAAVCSAIARTVAVGTPAGVLATLPDVAREYAAAGATFVGLGVDTAILAKATRALVEEFIVSPPA